MKKRPWLVLISTILILSCVLFGCSKKDEPQDEPAEQPTETGVTITFSTGFDHVIVPSLHLDGTSQKYMPEEPFCAGYTFLGWYYDKDGTKAFSVKDGFTEDTVLYAKWDRNKYYSDEKSDPKQETEEVEGVVYVKRSDGYYLSSYKGKGETVAVLDKIGEYSVVGILTGAFNLSSVKTLELPFSVVTIEGGAFSGAVCLTTINVSSDNPAFRSLDGVLYNKEGSSLLCIPQGREMTSYTLPEKTKNVTANALYGGKYRLLFVENSEITLEENAFSGFAGTVTITPAIKYICKKAFSGSSCVVDFAQDCALTALGNGEFDGYLGEKLVLPASVNSIGGSAFYSCTSEIDLTKTGLTALGDNAFNGYNGKMLFIPSSVRSLGSGCFYACGAEITFDERSSLQTVGRESFSNFRGKVIFPSTVRKVEKYAFYNAQTGAKIIFSTKQSQIAIDEKAFALSHAEVTYQ